jgi:hypothetical protein
MQQIGHLLLELLRKEEETKKKSMTFVVNPAREAFSSSRSDMGFGAIVKSPTLYRGYRLPLGFPSFYGSATLIRISPGRRIMLQFFILFKKVYGYSRRRVMPRKNSRTEIPVFVLGNSSLARNIVSNIYGSS